MGILVGDIGGTKTHLAIVDEKDARKKLFEKKYNSKDYEDFLSLLRDFLKNCSEIPIKKVGLGVAGPVQKRTCKTTNLPWVLVAEEITKEVGAPATLLNDLEATGYAISALRKEEFFTLNEGKRKEGNCAVLAPGTGLGEAGMIWNGTHHVPFACEGGHVDFAPRDELEMELLRYCIEEYGHVSYERLISGPGIYQMYRFLVDMRLEEEDPETRRAFFENDPPVVIAQLALEEEDPVAIRTMHWFASLYGAEAGNVALKFFSLGGIYLAGRITSSLASFIQESEFMKSFADKGRFTALLKDIPVHIVLNEETVLLGIACFLNESS